MNLHNLQITTTHFTFEKYDVLELKKVSLAAAIKMTWEGIFMNLAQM